MTRTATEQAISTIWAAELGRSDIEPESDFFGLGGGSLQMLNMLFHVCRCLGVEIPPGMLFEDATLRGFARNVDEARAGSLNR